MTPTHLLLIALDTALVLLATLRLTRLLVLDELGGPLFRYPFARAVFRISERRGWLPSQAQFWLDFRTCPFCIGFWLGAGVLASLAVVGGPGAEGTAAVVWRYVAGAFALNWVAAHVGSRMGDAGYEDDETEEHR